MNNRMEFDVQEFTALEITVTPRSSKRKIVVDDDGNIKAYLHSPPAEGKANEECIALFAKRLGLAKSRIIIHRGEKGRRKRILINGLSREQALSRLRNNSE